MAGYLQPSRGERARGAALAIGVQAVLGYALFTGLAMHMPGVVEDSLKVFAVAPPLPPPPREETKPHIVRSTRPEGAAAPPNLRSRATQVVAPKPIVIPPPEPPPIPVAEKAGVGADATSGNADIAGPGTGAGGVGNGTGSGRYGDGDGDGGFTAPVQIRGKLKDSDFPDEAGDRNATKPVYVDYVVQPNGRVTDCQVRHSSGSRLLDATTCRLIEERFRFRPSRDPSGRAVESVVTESHGWSEEIVPAQPGPPLVERRRRGFPF